MKDWYKITNQASGKAELWIYDVIGEDLWGEGIAAKTVAPQIAALDVAQIDVHIHSPGGNFFDGIAIYNALVRHPANKTSYIDSFAASVASVVAMAGEIVMPANSRLMVHNVMGSARNAFASELRRVADVVDQLTETIRDIYVGKSTKTADEIQAAMEAETWLTAPMALEYGFIEQIAPAVQMAACADFDFSSFRNPPADLIAAITASTPAAPAEDTVEAAAEAAPPRQDWVTIPALGRVHGFAPRQK